MARPQAALQAMSGGAGDVQEKARGAAVRRVSSAVARYAAQKRARTDYNRCIHMRMDYPVTISISRSQAVEAAIAFCLQ